MPSSADAAARVADLPLLRRAPFDRLLIAQPIDSGARLITADRQLLPYSDLVDSAVAAPTRLNLPGASAFA